MISRLADLLPDLRKEFSPVELPWWIENDRGQRYDGSDLYHPIFVMCILVPPGGKGLLGDLLQVIAMQAATGEAPLWRNLDAFEDALIRGASYHRYPRSLHDSDKVLGREMVAIVDSLDKAQRTVLYQWQECVLEAVLADEDHRSWFEDRFNEMVDSLAWLKGESS